MTAEIAADMSGKPRHRLRLSAPTSVAGVEQVLALAYGAARVATVLQMVPSLPRGVTVSQEPPVYAALWMAAAATAAGLVTTGLVRRRGPSQTGVALDVALTVVFLVSGTFTVPVQERVGSWVGWAPGYALAVVLSLGGLRLAAWCVSVGAVTGAYLLFVADAATAANRSTIVGDTLSLLVLGAVARIVVRYIRRVAADADEARARVAELARLQEEYRARLTMHDATTIMQLLTDPTLPAETRAQLCEQAAVEVRRMRAYLRGGPGTRKEASAGARRVMLRDALESGMSGFADLGLEPALELADGVTLDADAGEALRRAVAAVLHNVRRHARATMVVVHADAEPDRARWIVTIRDDGVGFDVAGTALGTGLRQQVVAELQRHALTARIASTPGLGTQITVEGKLDP